MENDLFETIRQHYNGIDINRLKKRAIGAAEEAASRLDAMPIIAHLNTPNNWARIIHAPEYKKAIAHIYTQISGVEKYIADDLHTLLSDEAAKDTPEGQELGGALRWLQNRCNDYHDLVEGTEYDLQPMPAATDTAAALPDSLKSDKAKRAFEIAKERGYISGGGNPYKWKLSPVLLAYFIGRLLGDEAQPDSETGKTIWKQSGIDGGFPAKAVEAYFGRKNVGQSRLNKAQTGYAPRGAAKIDEIIKELDL